MMTEPLKYDTSVPRAYGNLQIARPALMANTDADADIKLPEILFITSYPPRECGIATYSQDLIKALNNKFSRSFSIQICALESPDENLSYPGDIKYILNTGRAEAFFSLAKNINEDSNIHVVMIQHEFGLFKKNEKAFLLFLKALKKPIVIIFHTVLPHPGKALKQQVKQIAGVAKSIVVMTMSSAKILNDDYRVKKQKITVIPHGTHLVQHSNKQQLKIKNNLAGKTVLSTFGLLSSGKGIATTLAALPAIVKNNPEVLFLIIGKTHPMVVNQEGEKYRDMLEKMVDDLQVRQNVRFINHFLTLPELLEYLQLTDIYLFTSTDPNQAVSGTFSYAISCGCAMISTPIPHALEVLTNDSGVIVDFNNAGQLSDAVIRLVNDDALREKISSNGLHKIASTAWENSAIAHAVLFEKISGKTILKYNIPVVNTGHVKKLTTDFGMIQFSKINQPDISTGYTLDDNARAMLAMCRNFELTKSDEDLKYIKLYFNFIKFCMQPGGNFLNYVDEQKMFTEQNAETNLEDSNGRAVWALGYLVAIGSLLPEELANDARITLQRALGNTKNIHSSRAMAFIIKGIYYSHTATKSAENISLLKELANRLVQMYRHEASEKWLWFESYLTYANSLLPEAMLCAWLATGEPIYKQIAKASFDFLLSMTFTEQQIKVISNKGWLHKDNQPKKKPIGGEQPIDVAYVVLALSKFYDVFEDESYREKMNMAFNWFLGNNHLGQIIYNPCTGGCYDGLEEKNVNLNQGAESTVSYLMARLTIGKPHLVKV
jgi:glycosyltransferase involved in cell wall biosynthesis